MPKLDSATSRLIADLEAAPQSFARDEIIARARRLLYHDFAEEGHATPKVLLNKHLTAAGLHELAARCRDGAYDQGKDDVTQEALRHGLEVLTSHLLRDTAETLKPRLPPNTGFALFVFDFGAKGNVAYASTANRQDMIRAIREWLEHVED